MDYLDMSYSVPEESQNDNSKIIELLNFFIDAGITSKEPVDGNELAKELDQESQDLLTQILATKTDSQEKAIVTALINKYKNLDSDKKDVQEFKEHLKNMVDSDAIGYGSFNYLLERVTSGDVKEKTNGLKPQPDQPQEQPADDPAQEGQDPNSQSAPTKEVKETNNSDNMNLDYIDEWDNHLSLETDLTEDDFSDILGESLEDWLSGNQEITHAEGTLSHLNSSESVKNAMSSVNDKAKSFLKSKLKGKEMSYSEDDSDGFDRAATFLILRDKAYSDTLMNRHPNKEGLPRIENSKSVAHMYLNDRFNVKEEAFKKGDNFNDEGTSSRDKAILFMNSRDELYHSSVSMLTGGHMMRESKDNVSDGVSYMKLNKDKSLKTDVRGNLVTELIDEPKLR